MIAGTKPEFEKASNYILQRLSKLPRELHYHSKTHTLDVRRAARMLAEKEGVYAPEFGNSGKHAKYNSENLLLLETAALYHDSGFLERYENNEEIGASIARETLPKYGYGPDHIAIVEGMILATKMPQSPKNHLEEILCDADLDNLGRKDFFVKTELLRLELYYHGKDFSPRQWYESTLKLLESHKCFTASAREMRNAGKVKNIREIRDLLR